MADIKASREISIKKKIVKLYFLLAAVLGGFATAALVRIPGEQAGSILLGLSGERLVLAFILMGASLYSLALLGKAYRNPAWYEGLLDALSAKLQDNRVFGMLLIVGGLGVTNGINFRLWLSEINEPVTLAYYVRLNPVIGWIGAVCALTLITIHLLRNGWHPNITRPIRSILYPFTLISALFFTLWVWVSQSRVGLAPIDQGIGWIPLGIPILETQILLAWVITLGLMAFYSWLSRRGNTMGIGLFLAKNWVLGSILWALAFGVWMMQPLKPNWFATEGRPPNEVFYPNSDASVYDITAQNLLLGEGFKTRGSPYTIRPMYGLLLATLHAIGGLDYEPIIWMQVALLALIPVVLFALTARIHNRYSGFLAAMLFILRERNAINLGDSISDAHAKLLMPFLLTALGVLLFVWVMVVWMEQPDRRIGWSLLAGGLVGVFMLVRPEFGILFPFVGLSAFFHLKSRTRRWAVGMGAITLGLGLALAPWIWRNYQYTGTIFLDSPYYRLDLISRRYQDEPIGFIDPALLEETREEQDAPALSTQTPPEEVIATPEPEVNQVLSNPAERWLANTLDYLRSHPLESLGFIVKHLMNSVIQSVQAISPTYPVTFSAVDFLGHRTWSEFWLNCCSLTDYYRRLPYWSQWDGQLHAGTILPLVLNLALIAVGISVAWVKGRYIGLAPLFAAVGYTLVNSLVRNSGGRYMIPVNWVTLFYLSIGLVQLSQWWIAFWRKRKVMLPSDADTLEPRTLPTDSDGIRLPVIWVVLGILLVGSSLPVVERSIRPKLGADVPATRLSNLLDQQDPFLDAREKEILTRFLERGGGVMAGSALYPRFHKPGQMGSTWYFYENRPYANLDFYLSSPGDMGIVLPLVNPPDSFPHANPVLVFACPDIPNYRALAVVSYDEAGERVEILWREPMVEDPGCPLPKEQ